MDFDMFTDKDFFVIKLEDDYKIVHYRDDIFLEDCTDSVKKRNNLTTGDLLNFDSGQSYEILLRDTAEECSKFVKSEKEKEDSEEVHSNFNADADENGVILHQYTSEFAKIENKIDLVLSNQRLLMQNQEKISEELASIKKILDIKPSKSKPQTKNELVTLNFRCFNNKMLAQMQNSEIMKLILEKQNDSKPIKVNGEDIRETLRSKIDLTKNLGNASYCGTKVASFLAPVEFYGNALLLTHDGKGYAKARANGETKKIFNSSFCQVFYDSLKYLGASIFADEIDLDSWLAEARRGVHGRADQMAAGGRVDWYIIKDNVPFCQNFEEITEEKRKETPKPPKTKLKKLNKAGEYEDDEELVDG